MRTLTDDIVEMSAGLLVRSPEEADNRYEMFNGGSVEIEVAEFLHGFVRMVKPDVILETGTHKGVSAVYMGAALKENGRGTLITLEFDPVHAADAKALLKNCQLDSYVSVLTTSSLGSFGEAGMAFDFIFLDTEPQIRFEELLRFYPQLNPGGYVVIHDLHAHMHQIENEEHGFAWPYGPVPQDLLDLVRTHRLRPVHFENPRGMTMFYKPHLDAFTW